MKKTILFSAALALAALASAASGAQAADAFATTNLNVRTGPGRSYAVVGVLAAGTRVRLNHCHDNWCSVEQGSLQGWASESHLNRTHASVVVVPPPIIIRPPIIHRPWLPHRPHPRPPHPRPPHPKPHCKIAPGFPCK